MAEKMPDYRETGRELATLSGADLSSARPATVRIWEARGLALQALARGDMAEAEKVMAKSDECSAMHEAEAHEIASDVIAQRLADGWSRQRILTATEDGPTSCDAHYLLTGGVIAVARFPMTQISDMNGRGFWFSIRDLLPPLSACAHAAAVDLQPFQVGDKVWSWYKDEPSANYGQPDLPGDDANWRRRPVLFTVRSVTGPHLDPGYYAGRPHYQVQLRHQEGPTANHYTAGYHDVCPIAGRPWQMRGRGEYLQLVLRTPPTAPRRRAATAQLRTWLPTPSMQAQLDLFA
ncbi:MAG: hypothetical protein RR704_00760 [Stenotrophomonas sp.]